MSLSFNRHFRRSRRQKRPSIKSMTPPPTIMPNSHRPISAFCVGVRPAIALCRPTHSNTNQTVSGVAL